MNTIPRLFRCLKTALLAMALALPLSGWAQFNYYVNNGAVTITAYTGPGGAVTIPGTLGGFPVKNIGSYAFNKDPFVDYSLTSVTFPNSVTNIDIRAFEYCYGLTKVTFGSGLVSMELGAFGDCISLPSVSLPTSATNLGPAVFAECESLTNISLPPALPRISPGLLAGCSSLVTVTIPSSVTSIDEDAFSSCGSLKNIVLPAGVTNIDVRAFAGCTMLKSFVIPPNVDNIGYGAFQGSSALETLEVPASVLSIGIDAFNNCLSLTNISVSPSNPNYSSVDGVFFDKPVTTLISYPAGRSGGYILPDAVTNFEPTCFNNCLKLYSLTFPASVTQLNDNLLFNETSLTNVILPEGLKSIGDGTFEFAGLTHITIPNSVTNIGSGAFAQCPLTSVTIPAGVVNIGQSAFNSCTNLHVAYFLGNAPTINGYDGSEDFSVFIGDGETGTVLYLPGATGWETNYGGWPTMMGSFASHPEITSHTAGVQSNPFHFNINWVPDTYVVVEASTNLVNWSAINTNQLVSGTNVFADANWTNYPKRFYRVRSY